MEGSKFDDLGIVVAFRLIIDIVFATLLFGCLFYGFIIDNIHKNFTIVLLSIVFSPIIFIASIYLLELCINITKSRSFGVGLKINSNSYKTPTTPLEGKILLFNNLNTVIKKIYEFYYRFKVSIASLILKKSYHILILLWHSAMILLWYSVLPYLKRSDINDMWTFTDAPFKLYVCQYAFISVATLDTYFWILSKDEFENTFNTIFFVDFMSLPPFLLLIKSVFLNDLTIIQIYWLIGFIGIIKLLLKLNLYWNIEWTSTFTKTCRFVLNLFLMSSSYASLLYICQGLPSQLEEDDTHFSVFSEICNFYYLSIVTFSTVGYGDLKPLNKYAKLATVAFISWTFIQVPVEIHRLISIINKDNTHYGPLPSRFSKTRFILIIGDISTIQLNLFIYSMFTANCNKKLVILTNKRIEQFEDSVKLAKKLQVVLLIVKGDIDISHSMQDLNILHIDNASSIVLIDDFKNDYNIDLGTIGRAIRLARYRCNIEKISMQLFNGVSKALLNLPIQTVCLYQIKTMLFLKSLSCPGIIPLLSILSSPYLMQKKEIENTGSFGELPKASHEEYMMGLKGRLFSLKMPPGKVGMSFSEAVLQINGSTDLIIIGIQNRRNRYFILNPLNYKIQEYDYLIVAARSDDVISLEGVNPEDSKLDMARRKTLLNIALNTAIIETGSIQDSANYLKSEELDSESTSVVIQPIEEELIEISFKQFKSSNKLTVSTVEEALNKFKNPKLQLVITFGDISKMDNFLPILKYSGRFNVISIFKQPPNYDCTDLLEFSDFLFLIDVDILKDSIWDKINIHKAYHFIIVPQIGKDEYETDMISIIIHRKGLKLIQGNSTFLNWVVLTEIINPLHSLLLSDFKCDFLDNDILTTPQLYSPDYARGSVFFNAILYNFITHNHEINNKSVYPQVFLQLCKCATGPDYWDGLQLLSISEISKEESYLPCPTFNILYRHLFKTKKLVVIAIYRRGEDMFDRYLLPVPCPKTKIRVSDQIFVIPNGSIVHI